MRRKQQGVNLLYLEGQRADGTRWKVSNEWATAKRDAWRFLTLASVEGDDRRNSGKPKNPMSGTIRAGRCATERLGSVRTTGLLPGFWMAGRAFRREAESTLFFYGQSGPAHCGVKRLLDGGTALTAEVPAIVPRGEIMHVAKVVVNKGW